MLSCRRGLAMLQDEVELRIVTLRQADDMDAETSEIAFPSPRSLGPGHRVHIGGELSIANLSKAYRLGIFPWPTLGEPVVWASPNPRAILEFARLRVPRSLRRERASTPFRFTFDAAFPQVIAACASIDRQQSLASWITPEMIAAYTAWHQTGAVHSVEAWEGDELVGGLYGVDCGVFVGESMFHRRPNASKLALLVLIDHLAARGHTWIDIQVLTDHFRRLGAEAIPRDLFLARLAATQELGLSF